MKLTLIYVIGFFVSYPLFYIFFKNGLGKESPRRYIIEVDVNELLGIDSSKERYFTISICEGV